MSDIKSIMMDIVISRTTNGYIIEQRKTGYDSINRWVAESIDNLIDIISDICKKGEKEEQDDGSI